MEDNIFKEHLSMIEFLYNYIGMSGTKSYLTVSHLLRPGYSVLMLEITGDMNKQLPDNVIYSEMSDCVKIMVWR